MRSAIRFLLPGSKMQGIELWLKPTNVNTRFRARIFIAGLNLSLRRPTCSDPARIKNDRTVRRKSPEKTFTETDRYTVMLRDGTRHLEVENYLGDIENDFQGVIRAVRANEALTLRHRAKLATFTAAMLGRSKKQGD